MKKVIGILSTMIILILIIFLVKNNYKTLKIGNNISNKSIDEIENYILGIESYTANVNIEISSNKTKNIYVVEQKYRKETNEYEQKVLEPENLAGMEFSYKGKELEIKNNRLTLHKIYENYNFIGSNELSLIKFIEDYRENENKKIKEENNKIIMEVEVKQNNKYRQNKKLTINKEENKIEKLEIKDITQKTTIYILYNKIEINTLNKETGMALFKNLANIEI